MGRETVLFQSEERRDLAGVADFLRQLADRLEQREVVLQRGDQSLTLTPSSQVVLELKVEEEDKRGQTKTSLEVEIEWLAGDEDGGPVSLG